ncbi:MAG: histidinol-phosphate transaminase [Verrucomicrobiota bacterium]|jgi:histidinol-phosphate/aromatic aminotransferase/cobyric acid decarboxylase-like protein
MNSRGINADARKPFWYQVDMGAFRTRQIALMPDGKAPKPDRLARGGRKLTVRVATDEEREAIYRLRHEVYARELDQYALQADGRLTDALDAFNLYLVATDGKDIHGFVSITPPGHGLYSVDKYLKRQELPFAVDDKLYEVRILTIPRSSRRTLLALTLMYAAFRWVESHGGTRIMAIGRHEVLSMYLRVGLKDAGRTLQAGAVTYHLLQATMPDIHEALHGIRDMLRRVETELDWKLSYPFRTPAGCFHGGEFFTAVGEEFDALERSESVINADVLDAWFPPSPGITAALQKHLPWLLKTSPPTGCEGLVRVIAQARGVRPECVLPGAGSSDLIYRALRQWLRPDSRVLILDPTYGEYPHVLEGVIGCHAERLALQRDENYRLDPVHLAARLAENFDLVVLVNPNSPTSQHVGREELIHVLRYAPAATRIWVDETYVEYAGPDQSLEQFAASSENVIVCKSMSKVYALSGVRVAYLCAGPHQLEPLRPLTPPWAVSLPGQVAAVEALKDANYYALRYRETHALRTELAGALRALNWTVIPGMANFLLCHLPDNGPNAVTVIARCRERGLFLRDASAMGSQLGDRAVRIAVKDPATNRRMIEILRELAG